MTIGRQKYNAPAVDATDSGGQSIRYLLPPASALGSSTPLVIWCHPYTQSQSIGVTYWAYPIIHAAIQEGWMVGASNMHGENWGNDNGLTDVVNLYNYMAALQPVSGVVLIGASMGGLAAALTAAKGNLPAGKLKRLLFIDASLSLNWMYTGNSGTYTTAINTAYGVASYAAIPAGHEPMSFAASVYAGLRMRFYASTTDTSTDKAANTDAFRTYVTGQPTEMALVSRSGSGHLNMGASSPADQIAFMTRCFS